MWERRIGSVIVVDKEGKMAGIITESDILFAVTKSLVGRQVPVSSIMSKTSIMATPNESILTAVERMMKENVRHLPVIEKNGTPVGMVSTRGRDGHQRAPPQVRLPRPADYEEDADDEEDEGEAEDEEDAPAKRTKA